VNGNYKAGAKLNISDSVIVPITVFSAGTYTIKSDFVNGMSFSSSGIFYQPGNYNVTLKGSGQPEIKGITVVPITIANTICSFPISVSLDATMYWQLTADGKNYYGLLDSAYGALSDTGFVLVGKTDRIFVTTFGGGDINNNIDSIGFGMVLSRLNNPLTLGAYHPYKVLGGGDFNGVIQIDILNNGSYQNNFFYSTSANLNQFVINVTSYDPISKLLQGNFSGPLYKLNSVTDPIGPVVNITNGFFKTYLAQ
jgi:hypothetical protein